MATAAFQRITTPTFLHLNNNNNQNHHRLKPLSYSKLSTVYLLQRSSRHTQFPLISSSSSSSSDETIVTEDVITHDDDDDDDESQVLLLVYFSSFFLLNFTYKNFDS